MSVVLKVGGASIGGTADVVRELRTLGHSVCVVHGAGPQISAEMARRGLVVQFVTGRRVTDAAVLEVVSESLTLVNSALCAAIPNAVGLIGVIEARQLPELGLVGEPLEVAPPEVLAALAAGRTPVVAPLARQGLNVNADDAAAALAVALGATRLLLLTDVPGLLVEGDVVGQIGADDAESLLPSLDGGIVPKLLAAIQAVRGGVPAHIGETAVLP